MNERAEDATFFRARATEPAWVNFLHWVIAERSLRKALGLFLSGGAISGVTVLVIMRLLVLDRVADVDSAHTNRMDAIEAAAVTLQMSSEVNGKRIDTLTSNTGTILNAVCADFTRAQQRQRKMQCDPEIYRGAPGIGP